MYHGIAERGRGDRLITAPDVDTFRRHIEALLRHYRVVPASDLVRAAADRRRMSPPPVSITFDDDLPSHAARAMPILSELGAPATFFLNGASLERPHAFWWERLQRLVDERGLERGAMPPALRSLVREGSCPSVVAIAGAIEDLAADRRDALAREMAEALGPDPPDSGLRREEVGALSRAGFEIGFHTLAHPKLTPLSDADLDTAMRQGRAELEAAAGGPLTAIAYPHGAADDRVARTARAAGYTAGFTTVAEVVTAATDPMLVGRLDAGGVSVRDFATTVATVLGRAQS